MNLLLKDVSKAFGSTPVIRDLSESVEAVSSLVLIGPSGGGKSTLLRLIAGLLRVDSGEVVLNGESIPSDEEGLRQYRARLGVVFQSFNLFPHLTAVENIMLPLTAVHGKAVEEARTLAEAHLERFRLIEKRDQKPFELSGGQRQRVAIARALAVQPRVLLLDEPTSALDPEMTAEVLDVIQELRDEGVDFILVTHEMGFARRTGDRVCFVAEGSVQESAAPGDLFDSPSEPVTQRFFERVLKY